MSLILDALRRRPRSTEHSSPRRTDRGDAVLATLGYPKKRSPFSGPFEAGRLIFYALIVIVLGLLGWGSCIWYTSMPAAQPQRVKAPPSF